MTKRKSFSTLLVSSLLGLSLASCAGVAEYKQQAAIPMTPTPEQTVKENGVVLNSQGIDYGKEYRAYSNPDMDRFQRFNRWATNINLSYLDKYILRPIAVFNNKVVSPDLQNALVNLDNYLDEPFSLITNVGTGQFKQAGINLGRLIVNGLFGLGMLDWGQELGMVSNGNNFDYFLAYYNVGTGSYIMIPAYGPTVTRKLVAYTLVQGEAKSLAYTAALNTAAGWYTFPLSIYSGIVARGQLINQEAMIFNSPDRYATFKSVWLQNYSFKQSLATATSVPQATEPAVDLDLLDQFN
ncbi:MlaA family lipoprotein [Psittacicella hinzii]|uniref:Phospholipid-binding lipoprotein MlaA n=1 Tax=Psittacicella hinzii TaxID=2028575 RepID=A0A3A1YP83_9GAMM|nr:MlaA family lipoprotein [Psittacicella hinzii]RIY38770.1 hypothetical protein CKF58_03395 [Psittacicella hinzii]